MTADWTKARGDNRSENTEKPTFMTAKDNFWASTEMVTYTSLKDQLLTKANQWMKEHFSDLKKENPDEYFRILGILTEFITDNCS